MKRWLIIFGCIFLLIPTTTFAMNKRTFHRAVKVYNKTWKQDRKLLGQKGQAAPLLKRVPKGGGYAYVMYQDDQPIRELNASPHYLKRLGSKKPKVSESERYTTEHEIGHILGAGSEGHANRVANLLARQRNNKITRKQAKRRIRTTLNVDDG